MTVDMERLNGLARLAAAHFAAGRLDEALAACRDSFALSPDNPAIRRNYLTVLDAAGRAALQSSASRAAELFEEAVRIAPDSAEFHKALAVATFNNDMARSGGHMRAAYRLAPDDADIYGKGRAIYGFMTTSLDFAYSRDPSFYRHRCRSAPSCDSYAGLGNALKLSGDLDAAERAYRNAIADDPFVPFPYQRLGALTAGRGKIAEAERCYRRIVRLSRHASRERMVRLDPAFLAEIARRPFSFRRPVHGTLGGSGRDVVALCGCDIVYFRKFGRAFVTSLLANGGDRFHAHFHITNPDDAFHAADVPWLRERLGEVTVTWDHIEPEAITGREAAYYANTRLLNLPDFMRHWRRPIAFLDIDIVVVGDVGAFCDEHRACDLALLCNGAGTEPATFYSCDVMCINPTDKALAMFDLGARYIDRFWSAGEADWYMDQTSMFCAYWAGFPPDGRPAVRDVPHDDIQRFFHPLKASTPGDAWKDSDLYKRYA